jgi:hypothetical protein
LSFKKRGSNYFWACPPLRFGRTCLPTKAGSSLYLFAKKQKGCRCDCSRTRLLAVSFLFFNQLHLRCAFSYFFLDLSLCAQAKLAFHTFSMMKKYCKKSRTKKCYPPALKNTEPQAITPSRAGIFNSQPLPTPAFLFGPAHFGNVLQLNNPVII